VLILSASVGTGHLRAAEAIALALGQLAPAAEVRSLDTMALATPMFRVLYADAYRFAVRHCPTFVGLMYDQIDRPVRWGDSIMYKLQQWFEAVNLGRLQRLLLAGPWDLVINTFFVSADVVARLRRQGRFAAPQVLVTTDFETHRNWASQPCDHYFTATEEGARYLECFGVPPGRASATGVPIHPVFGQPKGPAECRARLGLPADRPVLLLLCGGDGAMPVEAPFRALLELKEPVDLVAVTGHNARAKRRLEQLTPPPRHRTHVLGYTDRMDELLAAADLVVTKPGGLTISEALARGAGLVLINPVPGQEERNSDFLLEEGAAVKANHLPTLPDKVGRLLRDRARLERLRANARRLGRPRAAFDVAERSLALIPRPAPA
jgi:processive 1,2-diacylglycerol beta-glucosyltransferase